MRIEKIYSRGGRTNLPLFSNKIKIIVIFMIAILTVVFMLRAINPIIDNLCMDKAKNLATKISNEQATNVMNKYKYEDFLNVERD